MKAQKSCKFQSVFISVLMKYVFYERENKLLSGFGILITVEFVNLVFQKCSAVKSQ